LSQSYITLAPFQINILCEASRIKNEFVGLIVFVLLFFWAYLLYPSPHVYPCFSVWVHVTQYTCEITFNGDPDFVASVPRVKGPASSEALPPRTYVLSLIFGLPIPCCICVFYFPL